MKKWIAALITVAFAATPLPAADTGKDDDILNHLIISASADSWNVWNAMKSLRDDPTVQAGKAVRLESVKREHSWDAGASITINKPVAKGDIILIAYYARVETPPLGKDTTYIPATTIGLNQAPYTAFGSEAATLTKKWDVYYISGVATDNFKKGTLHFSVQLSGDDHTIDLGPVFVFNLGPDYDRSKVPHNKTAAVAPAPMPAAPAATLYDGDLAKLHTKLPVKGTLINDPRTLWSYGPDQTSTPITVPEIGGGKATRTVIAKKGNQPWDDGVASPVTGAVKKGDVVFAAVQIRTVEPAPGSEVGLVSTLSVSTAKPPFTSIANSSATVKKESWTWVFASGVATEDYPAGSLSFNIQLGCCQQTLDIGPVFILNLGPGIDTASLPNNFGNPF